ncbi:MarR family winged helix-turn-helix transcriptional regulator [Streptomyces avicenniae]|uniref:MarR family winged helix-turn-helix transcriptional regulator n=1 Tax=Streptomyces avicenniae TaxID=500153 RepID=UPI000699BF2E|nr:MarR family transcriptional regulator [Streptomyces avicenniae]
MGDTLDWVIGQWQAERPGLDATPMGVVGRIQRASRLLERGLGDYFATRGLQVWEFDILATLLRAGPPYRLSAGALSRASMVTSGAVTHRIDRLVARGLATRDPDPDSRRSILVGLTDEGRALVSGTLTGHVENETRLLAALTPAERDQLAGLLRKLLVGLGDLPPA